MSTNVHIKANRRFFSLVEILLVIGFIAIVAGVVGVNIRKAIQEQRFKNELGYVLSQLELAQSMMLINKTSTRVKFQQDAALEGIKVSLEVDCNLSKTWEKQILRPPQVLKTIRYVNFHDELKSDFDFLSHKDPNGVEVQFLDGGGYVSRGVLALTTAEKEGVEESLSRFIAIKGYVAPFRVFLKRPEKVIDEKEAEMDRQISLQTASEVLERRLK